MPYRNASKEDLQVVESYGIPIESLARSEPLFVTWPSLFKHPPYDAFEDVWPSYIIDAKNSNGSGCISTWITSTGIPPIKDTGDALPICQDIQGVIVQVQQLLSRIQLH